MLNDELVEPFKRCHDADRCSIYAAWRWLCRRAVPAVCLSTNLSAATDKAARTTLRIGQFVS